MIVIDLLVWCLSGTYKQTWTMYKSHMTSLFGFHFLVFTFFPNIKSQILNNKSKSFSKTKLSVYPPGNLTYRYQKWPYLKRNHLFQGPSFWVYIQPLVFGSVYMLTFRLLQSFKKKPDLVTSSSLPLQICWPQKNIKPGELKSSNPAPKTRDSDTQALAQ